MQRFIDGALFESKGDYARAALEYQEALALDPQPAIYYALSKSYAALGKHPLAAQAAREAVQRDSTNISYRENLASMYMNMYQPELAIREYETIVAIDSLYTEGWYNLARLHQSSRPLRALEIYKRLLLREPDNWDILLQAAELYRTLGRHAEAADKYRLMLELDPGNRPLQRQLAETYGLAGKFDEAVALLEAMLEANENDTEALATLADLYLDRNDYERAVELFEKLQSQNRENIEVKMRVGMAYYGMGMVQRDSTVIPKARAIFEEIVEKHANEWRAHLHLAALAAMEQKDSAALYHFERVIAVAEWNLDAWLLVGNFLYERGEYTKVLETMQRAMRLHAKEARVHFLTGLAHGQLKQSEHAAAALERAFELNPNDISIIGMLALTYDGMEEFAKSDSLYERALRIDSTSHIILNNYSYSLAERGIQLERALEMAKQAVAAEPDNASYLDTLGWVYYKLMNLEEAERYIAQAIATGRASATVHEHMGDIYYQLGNKAKAMEFWERALKMNSENPSLKAKILRGSL